MTTFNASVWDRLMHADATAGTLERASRLSLAQYKRAIGRDLEVLLNTRVALSADELATYPACRESIVNFGLADFSQLSLNSSEDRLTVCNLLTRAIARHEPRLARVRARLLEEAGMVNRLSFAISGELRVQGDDTVVQFDVMLESSSLHYSIR